MSNIQKTVKELHVLDDLPGKNTFLTSLHPAAKLLVTILYIGVLVSFPKYDLTGTMSMAVVLVILLNMGEMPLRNVLRKLRVLMVLLLFLGAANLFYDQTILTQWAGIPVTGGVVSFLTLYLKGVFAITVSYVFITSTGVEQICYALQVLKVPGLLITVVMLIYRYLILLLKEAENVLLAYSLRAPGQKGIHIKAWGSLAGALLLRSMDRAEEVYESMVLRGFSGHFYLKGRERIDYSKSILFGIGMAAAIILMRLIPVFEWIGSL